MPTDVELQQTVDTVRQLQSQVNSGGPLSSSVNPPAVSNLKIAKSTALFGSTLLTLTWTEPQDANISEYRVYAQFVFGDNRNPVFQASFAHSPGNVTVTSDTDTDVVLIVQTVYENGSTLPFSSCPTVTSHIEVPTVTLPDGSVTAIKLNVGDIFVDGLTLTNNSPGAGQVAWSACTVYYQGLSHAITGGNMATTDKYLIWQDTSPSAFSSVVSYTPDKHTFLIATNTGGTGDTAWNKVAQSHVQTANIADAQITDAKITGTLTFGGTSTTTKFFQALDGTNTQVVWAGKNGTDYGIWAKNCWVGGTGPSTAVVTSTGSGVTINGATFTLNLNGATTTIGNTTVNGVPRVGVDVQNNSTTERAIVAPDFITLFNNSNIVAASVARVSLGAAAGVVKAFDGTNTGGIDGHGLQVSLDGSTGNVRCTTLQASSFINIGGSVTGSVTLSGVPVSFQPQAFLTILVAGVSYKIPLFLP